MLAMWDDHEFADDVNAESSASHQEVCPVDSASAIEQILAAGCDDPKGEGDYGARMNAAAQAWYEWMPIRAGTYFTDSGLIKNTDLTQVLEWGGLATFAMFDTRLAARTPPTGDFTEYFDPAKSPLAQAVYLNPNESTWDAKMIDTFTAAAEAMNAQHLDPSKRQLSDGQVKVLKDSFAASKAAGKPWQVFASQTEFGDDVMSDFERVPDMFRQLGGAKLEEAGRGALAYLKQDPATAWQIKVGHAAGLSRFKLAQGFDSWSGYQHQRRDILNLLKEHTNNAVVVSGDTHDARAHSLGVNGNGGETGEKICVNIGAASVTSPGMYWYYPPLWRMVGPMSGLAHAVYNMLALTSDVKYAHYKDSGFTAMRATKTTLTSDFFYVGESQVGDEAATAGMSSDALLRQTYSTFTDQGQLTAPSFCGKSLVTTAGVRGSLGARAPGWPATDGNCAATLVSARSKLLVDSFAVGEDDTSTGTASTSAGASMGAMADLHKRVATLETQLAGVQNVAKQTGAAEKSISSMQANYSSDRGDDDDDDDDDVIVAVIVTILGTLVLVAAALFFVRRIGDGSGDDASGAVATNPTAATDV